MTYHSWHGDDVVIFPIVFQILSALFAGYVLVKLAYVAKMAVRNLERNNKRSRNL